MNISEQDDRIIDAYLQKTLSSLENQEVLKRIETDAAFREEVIFRQLLQQASKSKGQQNLDTLLTVADQELDEAAERESKTTLVRPLFAYRWAAAAIALLILASIWYLLRAPEPQALYATYFEPFPNLVAPIDKSTTAQTFPAQALQAYERQDYELAVERFEVLKKAAAVSATDSVYFDTTDQLYYALSLLEMQQEQTAIEVLEAVAADATARYQAAAQWYLALAWLKLGDLDNCKAQLHLILAQPEHRYREKAERLAEEF